MKARLTEIFRVRYRIVTISLEVYLLGLVIMRPLIAFGIAFFAVGMWYILMSAISATPLEISMDAYWRTLVIAGVPIWCLLLVRDLLVYRFGSHRRYVIKADGFLESYRYAGVSTPRFDRKFQNLPFWMQMVLIAIPTLMVILYPGIIEGGATPAVSISPWFGIAYVEAHNLLGGSIPLWIDLPYILAGVGFLIFALWFLLAVPFFPATVGLPSLPRLQRTRISERTSSDT